MKLVVSHLVIACVAFVNGHAQTTARESNGGYYIDLNKLNKAVVYDVLSESLNIQYHDFYGRLKSSELVLYNGHNKEVGRFDLQKSYGLNHFNIDLGPIFSSWKVGEVYSCKFTDEMSHHYQLFLRKVIPETRDPEVSIFVNPLSMKCDELSGNLVDFYGSIKDGKAPYTVNWYVMNERQTEFLFQPRQEIIDRPGNTMVVRVDKNPNYYVMMLVTDACGKEQKQMVYLQCEDSKKKVNTLFVEPIKQLNKIKSAN